MVKRGENFSEMYMIFEGKVVLSLRRKFEHEFFMLYATNYFGDYQILEDHKATETYCASTDKDVYVHCMKNRVFIDLLKTFPDAMAIFFLRAKARRREFRRIRKMYERWVGFDGRQDMDLLPSAIRETVDWETYDEGESLPPHLNSQNTDFYFTEIFKQKAKPTVRKTLTGTEIKES